MVRIAKRETCQRWKMGKRTCDKYAVGMAFILPPTSHLNEELHLCYDCAQELCFCLRCKHQVIKECYNRFGDMLCDDCHLKDIQPVIYCRCNDRRWVFHTLSGRTPIIRVRIPCPDCNLELLISKRAEIKALAARVENALRTMNGDELREFSILIQQEIDNGDYGV